MAQLDYIILAIYAVGLIAVATWVSREKAGHEKNTDDYFLAGKSLPWWAIGASLIAANISAEQAIGMSGSGYVIGLAIASYEWMAAVTLLVVAKFLLPIYLKHNINTMPQFLHVRFDHRVRSVIAVFWLGVYIFVNLTSVLWLGAKAVTTITGLNDFYAMIALAAFAVMYSLYGGLKAVAYTDIIQVVILLVGGCILTYICLDMIADSTGLINGFSILLEKAPEKFDMILAADHKDYMSLPGLSVLLGGMWVMNISYWGFNQYIIQRALAAKNLAEGQKGIAFAAYLKLLMPIIVVLPGIAATIIVTEGLERADYAYPTMMNLMPVGIKGLVFAALVAAIVSSLGSMINSISTIFTLDLYDPNKKKDEAHKVRVGRLVSLTSLIIAIICARPLLEQFEQAFQYIQEFTGMFTPGIVALFLMGMFYKKMTTNAALALAISSVVLSLVFKIFWTTLPFMDRIGLVFVLSIVIGYLVSMGNKEDHPKAIDVENISFKTNSQFNFAALGVVLILAVFYVVWW